MSEIKALDFMRIWISADVHIGESAISREFEKAEGLRKLDAIEAEIAERFMELPVDADGEPIRPGDIIEFGGKGERLSVTHIGWTKHRDPTIAYRRPNGTLDCSCIGENCRHVRPRTVEDVLKEFACAVEGQNEGFSALLVKEYADVLRVLIGEAHE